MRAHPTAVGGGSYGEALAAYPKVDALGLWYKFVNFDQVSPAALAAVVRAHVRAHHSLDAGLLAAISEGILASSPLAPLLSWFQPYALHSTPYTLHLTPYTQH